MTYTTAELEREAEAARARVADTAESLKMKMTPGQMIDELTGTLTKGDTGAAFRNLKAQIRDNPLPLTLVGAGLAWLMFGQGRTASDEARPGRRYGERDYEAWDDDELLPDGFADESPASQVYGSRGYSTGDGDDREEGESFVDKLSDAAGSAKDTMSSAAHKVTHAGETLGKSAASARRGFAHRSERVGRSAAHMRHATQDLIEREPLVLAALGLAAGAAIGALLPRTAVEDEHLGGYGKKLRQAGEETLQEGIEEAKHVASEVYDTTKREAERQGLTPEGDGSFVDKVSNVARAAADKTEESLRDKADRHH